MKPNSPVHPVGPCDHPAQLRQLQQVSQDAPSRLKLFQRVYAWQTSPMECIKAFCLQCNGYQEASIRGCNAPACALYRLRPYQRKAPPTTVSK